MRCHTFDGEETYAAPIQVVAKFHLSRRQALCSVDEVRHCFASVSHVRHSVAIVGQCTYGGEPKWPTPLLLWSVVIGEVLHVPTVSWALACLATMLRLSSWPCNTWSRQPKRSRRSEYSNAPRRSSLTCPVSHARARALGRSEHLCWLASEQ